MGRLKMLPVGIENFEEIRTQGFYYVDKTGMIRDLLHNWGKVNLFTRPRRFGKSLNMSMLKSFFEIGCRQSLFENLAISEEKDLCEAYMGKFPVISISLKSVSGHDYDTARALLSQLIGNEAMRFQFLLDSESLTERERKQYEALINISSEGSFLMSYDVLINSLFVLSQLLHKHYNQKVIILIDEYDVPLDKAYQSGYYNKMAELIRNLFQQTLKTNDSLYLAVMTGCLRISKESIFTGLNNLKIRTISDVQFDEYFGFTSDEVKALFSYYSLQDFFDIAKEWYDGYHFGNISVFCPWDVINYCDVLRSDRTIEPENYWVNTSSNEIIKKLLTKAKSQTRRELEDLIEGKSIKKKIRHELTWQDIDNSAENLWSILYTTGYLTKCSKESNDIFELIIPNREIKSIFVWQIMEWFNEVAASDSDKLLAFCGAFRDGQAQVIENMFNDYLLKTISIRDTSVRKAYKENFYHGVLLGLLSYMEEWCVTSNRESGEGYCDILIEIEAQRIGIVVEVKYAEKDALDEGCEEALNQIREKKYDQLLIENGMRTILKYGIACYKKHCKVVLG